MIFDSIKNCEKYFSLHEGFEKAFEFIKKTEEENLPAGKYEVDGENVFGIVQEYNSKNPLDYKFEGHTKYIDIQYVSSGTEAIEVLNIKNATAVTEYIPEREVRFYEGDESTEKHVLEAGDWGIFYPEDIHKPGLMCGEKPTPVKKILMKVKMKF